MGFLKEINYFVPGSWWKLDLNKASLYLSGISSLMNKGKDIIYLSKPYNLLDRKLLTLFI